MNTIVSTKTRKSPKSVAPAAPTALALVRGEPEIRAACRQLGSDLDSHFAGMGTESKVLVLGAIAGQHVVLLGQPGVAKTEITERFAAGIGGRYFYRNLDESTMPTAVFGPFDMVAATTTGEEVHRTDGFLPTADIAMLDECFKSNSMTLNAMLPALSPRRTFVNNGKVERIPLTICVGASNEYPRKGNDAMWDRFPLRCWVEGVTGPDDFSKLWEVKGSSAVAQRVTVAELDLARQAARSLPLGSGDGPVARGMFAIIGELAKESIRVSPRKVKLAQQIMQAHAWLRGASEVELEDLEVLVHVLWDHHDQRAKVEKAVLTHSADPQVADIKKLYTVSVALLANAPTVAPKAFDSEWANKWTSVLGEVRNACDRLRSLGTKSLKAEQAAEDAITKLSDAAAPLRNLVRSTMGF